jgi:hypothetical protein
MARAATTVLTIVTTKTKVQPTQRGDGGHPVHPERQQGDTADDRLDSGPPQTFGEYLQSQVDEHNLLRREY